MSRNVYILSLPHYNSGTMYFGINDGPTLKLGDAKAFPSKIQVGLSKVVNTDERFWDVTRISAKKLFKARLEGI